MRFARPGMMLITVAITGLAPVLTTTTAWANTSMSAGHGAVVDQDVVAARQAGKAGIQATGGTRLWVALYKGSNGSGQATAIAASPHGSRVFVTGLNGDSPPHQFYGTVAYNSGTGARLWTASYRGPAGDNFATAIAVSPDGSRVFVTGYSVSAGGGTPDYATVAYAAATGARLWVARYNGPAGDAFPASLAVSPDGSAVFVTGYSATTTGGFAYATVAYDAATGARRWVARYTGSAATGDSTASSVAVSPDGSTVFVTGSAATTTSVRDYATIAYAAATGARRWVARYNGPLNMGGYAGSVAVSPDGSAVFVTGSTAFKTSTGGFPVYSYGTVAYAAATGARLWVARYDGPFGGGSASSIAVSPDGSAVFVTGTSAASATAALAAYATVAYAAATGARLWVARYNGPFNESSATQIVASPNGSEVFVTGSAVKVFQGIGQYQYATVAYDAATGSRRWLRLYPDSNRYSPGVGIAASPDGSKVFVTGITAAPGLNYATVAYTT
jgi:hypothetical protein